MSATTATQARVPDVAPPTARPRREVRPAPRRSRLRARPRVAVDAVVLGVTVLIALLPLVPVYGMRSLAPTALGGVLLGAGLAALAARRRWDAGLTAGALLAAYVLLGGALAMPTAAWAGVLPSPATVTGVLSGAVRVWKEVLTLDPELGAAADVLVAPYVLAMAGSAAAVSIATRSPRRTGAWAGLVPVVVLGVALVLGTKTSVQPGPAGVATVGLLLPWAAWHLGTLAARRVVALGVVAGCVAGAGIAGTPYLLGDAERLVVRDEMVPPFDPRDHPSPLSGFRAFIKDWRETDLLTVRGLPEGARVRLATMDAYDGVVWNVAGSEQSQGSGSFRRVGETIDTAVRGERARVEFEVHELPMVWLPTVGYAERFRFRGADAVDLAADLRYNDATGTAVLTDGIPVGTRWTVDTIVPEVPDESELGPASLGSTSLPTLEGVPEAVLAHATTTAQSASSPALIATSLAEGLAQRGYFSHGVEDGEEPSLSGHGADRITTLLTGELMVGDGEQYAAAMGLMARELGLPARVVLGFVPDGTEQDTEQWVITGDDIQAWVEIEFAGLGWVAFDPTPDESRTPQEDPEPTPADPQPEVQQPPPPLQDPVEPPEEDAEAPQARDVPPPPGADVDWGPVVLVTAGVGVPLLALLVPPVLIALAKRRLRRARRTTGDPVSRVVGGWQDLLDEARDLRRGPPRTATRRETAVHLASAFPRPATGRGSAAPPVGGTVAGLAASADAAVFGPGQPAESQVELYWQQVEVARRGMRSSVPRRHRFRSRWTTASLRAARRARKRR